MEKKEKGSFIFFLIEKDDEVPQWFLQLSLKFTRYQINIIPVTLNTFLSLTQELEMSFLLIPVINLKTKFYFERALKSSLGFAFRAGKIKAFHLSSFGELAIPAGRRLNKNYFYYKLPVDMDVLVKEIAHTFMISSKSSDSWPGGKNKKLPLEIIG